MGTSGVLPAMERVAGATFPGCAAFVGPPVFACKSSNYQKLEFKKNKSEHQIHLCLTMIICEKVRVKS